LNDASCAPWTCASGDPFVRRAGATLFLKGRPFRFVGVNAWGVGWGGCQYSGFSNQDAALSRVFSDLADMRVQVLRAWGFQSFAGQSGADYSALDEVVRYARSAGVRLIFVLENMNPDCSKGTRDDSWFQTGFAQPYGGYALSLPDYTRGLVAHFQNEPTILAWEIMHEASGNDASALLSFFTQMSALVRSEDPNHLVVLGTNDGDTPGTSVDGDPSPYSTLQALDTVDLIDTQDFSAPDTALTSGEMSDCAVAQALHKPCFVGASAVSLTDASAAAFSQRASRVTAKLQAALDAGDIGFLEYAYTPAWQTPTFDFDGRSGEPLAGAQGVLADFAARARQ
jgi:hypothetical protein